MVVSLVVMLVRVDVLVRKVTELVWVELVVL